MIPGVGSVVGGASTLSDLLSTGTLGGAAGAGGFMEALKTGMKLGDALKGIMGSGGGAGGGGSAGIQMPQANTLAASPLADTAKQITDRATGGSTNYATGYTPTANATLRSMFGR
jgi:hypothetical protein